MFYNPFFTDDDEYYDIDELDYGDSLSIRDLQTSDTLVLHPSDTTTDFLMAIYEGKGWDVVNDPFIDPDLVEELIDSHDRIICTGHGNPDGLFGGYGMIINSDLVPLLRAKEMMAIWCNADQFIKKHKLNGFFTGMFLSDTGECDLFGVPCDDELQVELSNDLFASVLGRHIDSDNILENIKREYHDENDPIISFNRDRLYCNKENR